MPSERYASGRVDGGDTCHQGGMHGEGWRGWIVAIRKVCMGKGGGKGEGYLMEISSVMGDIDLINIMEWYCKEECKLSFLMKHQV